MENRDPGSGGTVFHVTAYRTVVEILDDARNERRQGRRQFSISTLMLIVFIVAVVLSLPMTFPLLTFAALFPLFTLVTLWYWALNRSASVVAMRHGRLEILLRFGVLVWASLVVLSTPFLIFLAIIH